jgi:hypothetical protein
MSSFAAVSFKRATFLCAMPDFGVGALLRRLTLIEPLLSFLAGIELSSP